MSMADPPYFLDDDGNIQIDAEHNADYDAVRDALAVTFNDHYGDDDEGCDCGVGPTVGSPEYDHAGHLGDVAVSVLARVFPPGEGDR